jgi:hypothetical protein
MIARMLVKINRDSSGSSIADMYLPLRPSKAMADQPRATFYEVVLAFRKLWPVFARRAKTGHRTQNSELP